MEPNKNSSVGDAIDKFKKKEAEIDGAPRSVSVPQSASQPNLDLSAYKPPTDQAAMPSQTSGLTPQGDIAQGYNPSSKPPSADLKGPDSPSTPKTGPNVPPASKEQEQTQPAQPATSANPKEKAPDIGKDYGDSLGSPAAHPAEPVQRENPNMAENGAAKEQDSAPGANRPDELERAKQEKEQKDAEKKSQEEKEKKAGDEIQKNPEAPDSSKKPKEDDEQSDPAGNGYGALKNPKNKQEAQSDSTEMARRNLEHNNRVKQGQAAENGTSKPKASSNKTSSDSGSSGSSGLSGIGQGLRNAISKGLTKRGSKTSVGKGNGKNGKNLTNAFKGGIKRKIMAFIATHPHIFVIIVIVIILLLMLIVDNVENLNSGKGKNGTHCTYDLKGVVSTGSVELSGLKVELINCDGTASDYTVLETVDFEKYVLGVALAEIGPSSPDEAIKTQIIAARGFALTRNGGMCPGNRDDCFYGYNASTGKIRMRACEADQVYWDYTKDIYRQERGAISLYSPEVTSGTLWKFALSEDRRKEVQALADQVKGEVLVDQGGYVVQTNYVASVSDQFIAGANEGKTYEEILKDVYGANHHISKASCTSYGNIDYGDYVLSSEGHEILHQPLDSFLESKGTSLEEFNGLIAENVDKAGYGTRAGVVAAAVTLIAELGNNYGVKVPYYWGGGHYDGVVEGALGYWGSTQCHTYANNTSYNYCGLDCSGFVPWAIKNGGFNMVQNLAGNFQNLQGARRVSLSSSNAVLAPGDLLESSGHIVLVVGVEEDSGTYICAEASGNSAGVLFTRRSFAPSGYWGVQMDGYYESQARSK